jgi:hypothetical protein
LLALLGRFLLRRGIENRSVQNPQVLLQALEGVKDKEKSVALVALVAEAIEAGPAQVQRDSPAMSWTSTAVTRTSTA